MLYRKINGNISKATNDGLDNCSGDYVIFMDNDDELAVSALDEIAYHISQSDEKVDLLYSDEDKISEDGRRYGPLFKRAWSPISLNSFNYMNHLLCVRRDIVESNSIRFDSAYDGCQDFEFIHKLIPLVNLVIHIPKVLYHWRAVEGSIAKDGAAKELGHDFFNKGLKVITDRIISKHTSASVVQPNFAVEFGLGLYHTQIRSDLKGISVLCVNGSLQDARTNEFGEIIEIVQPANLASAIDEHIRNTKFEYVLVLNDVDISVANNYDFLSALIGMLQLDHVGIVTPKILLEDKVEFNEISLNNYSLGQPDIPQYKHVKASSSDLGYYYDLAAPNNSFGINSRFFALKATPYRHVGYDLENFPHDLFNVDYAIRLKNEKNLDAIQANDIDVHLLANLRENEYSGYDFKLNEIVSFKNKYRGFKDRYYNPNLSRERINNISTASTDYNKSLEDKRILAFTHNLKLEGAPKQLLQILIGIKKGNPDTIIEVISPSDGPLKDDFNEQNIPVHLIGDHLDSSNYDSVISKLKDILVSHEQPANLFIANTLLAFHCFEPCFDLGIPTVWCIHESYKPEVYFSFLESSLKQKALKAFNHARACVFVAKSTRDVFQPYNYKKAFHVINNAIYTDDKVETESVLDDNIDEFKDKTVFLNLGSVCERKGQLQYVKAALKFLERSETAKGDALFVLVGGRNDRYQELIEEKIKASNFASNFSIVGETKNVGAYYKNSDVFVCSSFNESYPKVILEALSYGLPIISSSIYGINEQIINNYNGLLYDPKDVSELSYLMERLYKNSDLRLRLSENATLSTGLFLSFSEMISGYERIFKTYMN